MRWRFVDRITELGEWKSISGIKTISLEEYSLLEPFGRKGDFPASLVIECCVELMRWLVLKSSSFEIACVVKEIPEFSFSRAAGIGEVLEVSASVFSRDDSSVGCSFSIKSGEDEIGSGRIYSVLIPVASGFDTDALKSMWEEVRGAS
ncbi:MAG: hypothetical protein ACYS8W_05350 [Planctomycetota bacterium]|jgi:hypothetical protein